MAQPLLLGLSAMLHDTDSMDQILEKPSGLARRYKILIGVAALLLLSLIPLWPALRRWSSADQAVDLARLRTATVTRGDLERDVAAEGRIVAANHPRLYSPADGTWPSSSTTSSTSPASPAARSACTTPGSTSPISSSIARRRCSRGPKRGASG